MQYLLGLCPVGLPVCLKMGWGLLTPTRSSFTEAGGASLLDRLEPGCRSRIVLAKALLAFRMRKCNMHAEPLRSQQQLFSSGCYSLAMRAIFRSLEYFGPGSMVSAEVCGRHAKFFLESAIKAR
jgi:hypothetical protein